MLEISKNFQGRHFSQNPVGGTKLAATFNQLPCVKISAKSDKNWASDMDLKFAKFQKIFRAVILVKIRGEAHFPRQLSASYLVSKFRQNRSNGLRATASRSFQDLALHLCVSAAHDRWSAIRRSSAARWYSTRLRLFVGGGHHNTLHTNARLDLENFESM